VKKTKDKAHKVVPKTTVYLRHTMSLETFSRRHNLYPYTEYYMHKIIHGLGWYSLRGMKPNDRE